MLGEHVKARRKLERRIVWLESEGIPTGKVLLPPGPSSGMRRPIPLSQVCLGTVLPVSLGNR